MRQVWPIPFQVLGLQKKVAIGFVLTSAITASMSVVAYKTAVGLVETQQQVEHTHEILRTLEQLLSAAKDVETGGRGFLLVGREEYLEPYYAGKAAIQVELRQLEDLLAERPSANGRYPDHFEQLPLLKQLINVRVAITEERVEARRQQGYKASLSVQPVAQGKRVMDQIRSLLAKIQAEEEKLLNQKKRRDQSQSAEVVLAALAAPVFDTAILVVVYALINREINQRKRTEADLRQSEERFSAFMNNSHTVAFMKTAAGRYIYVNQPFERFFQMTLAEVYGKTDFEIWGPEVAAPLRENDLAVLRRGERSETVEMIPIPGGHPHYWLTFKFTITNGQEYLGAVAIDITERIQAEEALRLRDRAIAAASDGIVIAGPPEAGNPIIYVNPAFCKMTGYTAAEILGRDFLFYVGAETDQAVVAQILSSLEAESSCHATLLAYRKNGENFWNELTVTPTPDVDDRVGSFVGVMRDVTERRRAEEQLRLFQSAVYHAQDSILITNTQLDDPGPEIVFVNPAFSRITHYTAEEIIGKTPRILQGPKTEPAVIQRLRENLEKGEIFRGATINYRKDGTENYLDWSVAPILNQAGEATHYVVVQRDDTERRQAEATLQEFTNKLEQSNRQLEEFAYVASHDLQEPLRKIQAFGDRLKAKSNIQLGEEGLQYLNRMQHAAQRMRVLIDNLLCFSRIATKGQPFMAVDLNQIVQEVLSDLEVRIEQLGAQVVVGDLPIIQADSLQVRQLLQNLLGNALKFHRPGVPPVIQVSAAVIARTAKVTVADNGIGFDPQYAEQIFNVFERLHGRGGYEGTGMGLAICRKIVERHGGKISAKSRPQHGSQFEIDLPV